MVRKVLFLLILLNGCISLKNDKSWDNSLDEIVEAQLIIPDVAYIGDTVIIGIEFLNNLSSI